MENIRRKGERKKLCRDNCITFFYNRKLLKINIMYLQKHIKMI